MQASFTLRPMGIGDILDGTFKLYRQNFGLFVGIYAATLVPVAVVQMLAAAAGNLALWFLVSVLAGLASLLPYTALIQAVSCRYLGRPTTVGQAYTYGLPRFLPLLGASIVAGVLAVLPAVTIIGIIATIYLAVRWGLIAQTAVLERAGVRGAMSRTWALTDGYWLKVFLTGLLLFILLGIVGLVLGAILGAVAGAVGLATGGVGTMFGIGSVISTPTSIAINQLVSIVADPIVTIGATLLYYDLRVRKEGYDLELMAQELAGGSDGVTRA